LLSKGGDVKFELPVITDLGSITRNTFASTDRVDGIVGAKQRGGSKLDRFNEPIAGGREPGLS
jgi:hypothetical protein